MDEYNVAAIPGDGIGPEVMDAAKQVLDTAGSRDGVAFKWGEYPWGCEYYAEHGEMMPPDALSQLSTADAIFLGAVGYPGVPDHVSLWGLLIPIRRHFQQYINIRPVRLLGDLKSPLANADAIDFLCVRENNEGEYSQIGGRLYEGTPDEIVIQDSVFTRRGVERVIRYAFEQASASNGKLVSATKSNGIIHTMPFWDEIFAEIGEQFPNVDRSQYHVDALAAKFVLAPQEFDVVVGSNLFGDILTDLGAAIVGSIGIAPSGNINPTRQHPSMFEPVHGSAPDIAGRGISNPIGQLWSGALMLDHLGHSGTADSIMAAVEQVLVDGIKTPDLGGNARTMDVADAVCRVLESGPAGE